MVLKKIILSKNKSVILSDHFESFISDRICSGRYHSVSEVICAGLSLPEAEERKMEVLQEALEDGERSGMSSDFDPNEHLKSLRDMYLC